jgi:hypothetical protein
MADKLWGWVLEDFQSSEDGAKRELFEEWRTAMDIRDTNLEAALSIFDSVTQKAKTSGQAWFEAFVLHWKLQTLLRVANNPQAALPIAAHFSVELQNPVLADFPERVVLHEDLISVYRQIDPIGYGELIEKALEILEREGSANVEAKLSHIALKASYKAALSSPDCIDIAFQSLALCDEADNELRRVQALRQICETTSLYSPEYAREHLPMLGLDALEIARRLNYGKLIHELVMWLALGLRYANDENTEKTFNFAIDTRKRYAAPANAGYYLAAELYHIENGDLEAALDNLNTELAEIENRGEVFREVTRRLAKCHLLKELEQDWKPEAAKIKVIAQELKDSSWVSGALQELNA